MWYAIVGQCFILLLKKKVFIHSPPPCQHSVSTNLHYPRKKNPTP